MLLSNLPYIHRWHPKYRFQSLLSWMLLSNDAGTQPQPAGQCFNPCYPGCCSQTRTGLATSSTPRSFNPCYPGCCSQTLAITYQTARALRFNPCYPGCCSQTRRCRAVRFSAESFNPCYPGCCSQTGTSADPVWSICEVSILVILDVALKHFLGAGSLDSSY